MEAPVTSTMHTISILAGAALVIFGSIVAQIMLAAPTTQIVTFG